MYLLSFPILILILIYFEWRDTENQQLDDRPKITIHSEKVSCQHGSKSTNYNLQS